MAKPKKRQKWVADATPTSNGVTVGTNGLKNTVPDPMFDSFKKMQEYMESARKPKPREIKHVVLDADGVIWRMPGIASYAHPIGETETNVLPIARKLDPRDVYDSYYWDFGGRGDITWEMTEKNATQEDIEQAILKEEAELRAEEGWPSLTEDEKKLILEEAEEQRLMAEELMEGNMDLDLTPTGEAQLLPTVRKTIEELTKRGIKVSVASINDKEPVERLLEAFQLKDMITDVEADFQRFKGDMVDDIARHNKVDTSQMLFVNDDYGNVRDVATHTEATALMMGHDILYLEEILDLIK